MSRQAMQPSTGVPSYDRASFSRVAPVLCARTAVHGSHILIEGADEQPAETTSPGGPRFVIWLARSNKPLRLSGLSKRGFEGRVQKGSAMIVAPNSPTTWEATQGSPGSIHIALEPARLQDILQDDPFSRGPMWRSVEGVRDDALTRLALVLEAELRRSDNGCALLISSVVTAIALHAVRSYASEKSANAMNDSRLRLPAWRVRRVLDYIEERLGQTLSLTELAATVGLSTAHFSRSFKCTLGMTPHAFVTRRRLDAAERMLRERTLPIAEIALCCGFSSQAHLTEVFRKEIGVTPGRYRREIPN